MCETSKGPVIDLSGLSSEYQVIAYFESRRRAIENPAGGISVTFKMLSGNKRFAESLVQSEMASGDIKMYGQGQFALAC